MAAKQHNLPKWLPDEFTANLNPSPKELGAWDYNVELFTLDLFCIGEIFAKETVWILLFLLLSTIRRISYSAWLNTNIF